MNNIYQTAREACGITQERAAELIGLSVESIRGYETERRIPSDDTVIKMVDIYDANYLAYQHLKYKTRVGNVVLPDLNSATLPEAALQWIHEMNDCMEYQASIIEIAMDGKVDDKEKGMWEHAMKKCRELCRAVFALQFVTKKNEKEE
mgnify:CR=1 FL=1